MPSTRPRKGGLGVYRALRSKPSPTGKTRKGPLSGAFSPSGRRDLNSGPLVPQTSALTRLRHAPSKHSLPPNESGELAAQALVEPVDQLRHRFQFPGDDAKAVLAEMLRLDPEGLRQLADDLVRGHRPVAVDEVVQVPRGELGLVCQRAIGHRGLGHQALDCRPEGVLAELPAAARHQRMLPSSARGTRRSSPLPRSRTSTAPSSSVFLPTVTRIGHPMRSASANFSPALASRSSRSTSAPASSSTRAASSASSSAPGSAITCASYGAIDLGQMIPFSSWPCSTAAATMRPGPIP